MKKVIFHFFQIILFFFLTTCYAETINHPKAQFDAIFSNWTAAFNNKNLEGSCDLFSKQLTADYRRFPTKNYQTICSGFKKIFQENNRHYRYHYQLHQVYQSGDLAVARITWFLDITENNTLMSRSQDKGIDIFEKEPDGKWRIIQYIGYAV